MFSSAKKGEYLEITPFAEEMQMYKKSTKAKEIMTLK